MRTAIFDLDGTLADTSGDLIASANSCFRGLGYGDILDPVADASTAFQGGRAMLKLGFERVKPEYSAQDIDAQYPILLEAYAADIDVYTTLYPGAIEAIEGLKSKGYALGVCTNKPAALAEVLLQKLGVRGLFASMIGADTLPVRKPDPAPFFAAVEGAGGNRARAFLLGDTITDRKTATAAGVPCALVTFGPDGRQVADLKPEALLEHFSELEALAHQLTQ